MASRADVVVVLTVIGAVVIWFVLDGWGFRSVEGRFTVTMILTIAWYGILASVLWIGRWLRER